MKKESRIGWKLNILKTLDENKPIIEPVYGFEEPEDVINYYNELLIRLKIHTTNNIQETRKR